MSKQNKNNPGETPLFLQLSTKDLTDTDRVIALQLATSFAERFNLPQDRQHLELLTLAFTNGISFARAWDKLTPEQRRQTEEYYKPLARDIFGTPEIFNISPN